MSFSGFPDPFPDSSTIWLFKECLTETGKDKMVWAELQRQLDSMGLLVWRGAIKMPHTLRRIQDHQRNRTTMGPGLVAAEMGPGLRRANSIKETTSVTA
jgi:IS5 family transposase